MPDALVLADSTAARADVASSAFVCSWTDGGLDAAWVHVAGELDHLTEPQLERTLREPQLQARLVVLDLRELAFIDSSGALAIVGASIRARQSGRRLIVLRGLPSIDRVFTLALGSDDVEIGDVDSVKPPARARAEAGLSR